MRKIPVVIAVALALAPAASSRAEELRTAWGDPDLQGIWSNATLTPLERPANVDKAFLTEEEVEALNSNAMEVVLGPLAPEVELSGELNESYLELGQAVRSGRTSLIVDPPDGKIPFTEEGRERWNRTRAKLFNMIPVDSYADRPLNDRCLLSGGIFLPNPFYLNNHQILQTPDYVAIKSEVMNETKIIPLDGPEPPGPGVGQWAGVPRGRWDGDTLVVEITNFNGKGQLLGSTDQLRIEARFERVDAETIDYEVTFTDPASYTQPWTMANTMERIEGPIYEYACHEGNYSLVNILEAARLRDEERQAEGSRK